MSSSRIARRRPTWRRLSFSTALALGLCSAGCTHVAGNFPPPYVRQVRIDARFIGEGFQLLAGPSLRLDQVEAELGQLKSQGYSRRDPQVIKSVARRKHVPVGLLADRSGSGYFRFTAHLDPGTSLTLAPGALKVTVQTGKGTAVVLDRGYLLEDRGDPAGCRPPRRSTLAFRSPDGGLPTEREFLVRLPVQGKIVDLEVVPGRVSTSRK